MSDLVAFLLARIAEDQEEFEYLGTDAKLNSGNPEEAGMAHLAQRLLAEVQAKRKIVAEHWRWNGPRGHWDPESMCACCVSMVMDEDAGGNPFRDMEYLEWPCPTLRLLASVYSAHPEFQESWKP